MKTLFWAIVITLYMLVAVPLRVLYYTLGYLLAVVLFVVGGFVVCIYKFVAMLTRH